MRTIKIFLASSAELKSERKAIWELTAEVGKLFPNLHLDPFEWEIDLPSGSVREEYIQQAINPKLLECDIVFVLFYSKAGVFTVEELNLAIANDKKVFVYFKEGFSTNDIDENARYAEVLKLRADIEADKQRTLSKPYREGGLKEIYQMDLAKHLRDAYAPLTPRRIRALASDDLIYQDLDNTRSLPQNPVMRDYYFARKADDKLREALADSSKNFIIVKGGPLAGKTRATLEAFKKRPGQRLLIPDLYGSEDWRLEPADDGSLLIFNDFDLFCEQAGKAPVNKLLHECAANKVRVLATCRIGPEFNILQDSIETRFWENKHEVEMPPLRRDEFTQIEQYFLSKEIRLDQEAYKRLDYHVGSLFLDLETMRKRYRTVKEDKYELPHGILQTIKAFFIGYNKLPDGSFDKKKVKVYQNLYAEKTHSLQEWDKAFGRIEASDSGLGFIRFNEQGNILIEEAYLTVVINDWPEYRFKEEIEELFPDPAERREFGFYGVRYWTIKLNEKQKLSKKEGEVFLEEMRAAGVQPNFVTFNSLINKAADASEARQWYTEMRQMSIEPTFITFNSLINKAADTAEARKWYAEMRAAAIQPTDRTFNTLIDKSTNISEARYWLEEMRAAGVQPDFFTFTSLINKAANASEARLWLEEMLKSKIRPDIFTISSLLKKCGKDCEGIRWVESVREQHQLRPDFHYSDQLEKARRRLGC